MAGLASMALGDAYVNIMGETAGLQRSLLQAHAMVSGFAASAGGMLAKAMFLAPFAVGGAMIYSLKKFMEAEVVSKRLASAIGMVGGNIDILIPKYNKLADAIARKTKWDDEQVKSAMSLALGLGLSAEKMEEAIPAAVGLAARRGMDLSSAMMMITRAGMGNTMMLQRWFPELKNATTQQEKWNMAIKIGRDGLKMAEAEITTLSGAFGQMRKALGEVTENYGYNIEKALSLTEIIKYLTGWIWRWKEATDGINASNNKLTAAIGLLQLLGSKVIVIGMTVNAFVRELGVATAWLGDQTGRIFFGVINAIGAVTNAIYTNFTEAFSWLGGYIKGAITNIIDWWRDAFTNLWTWIKNPVAEFKFPEWKGFFAGIEVDAENSQTLIKESWKTAFNEITGFKWAAPWEGTLLEDIDRIKEMRDLMAADIVAGPGKAIAEAVKGSKKVGEGGGVADKASFSIISMSDQWKKMQEGIAKNKDEKEIKDATKKTATNTEKIAEGINTLIRNFDEDDSSTPLFAAGY